MAAFVSFDFIETSSKSAVFLYVAKCTIKSVDKETHEMKEKAIVFPPITKKNHSTVDSIHITKPINLLVEEFNNDFRNELAKNSFIFVKNLKDKAIINQFLSEEALEDLSIEVLN